MKKKDKRLLGRIIASLIIATILEILKATDVITNDLLRWLYIGPYLVVGYEIVVQAILGIVHGELLDERFLMTVASIGAFALGDAREAFAVMAFYQIGELFQSIALGKARKSISGLMDLRPDEAHLLTDEGIKTIEAMSVAIGSLIIVQPGEKVPLDGIVTEGETTIDSSLLTGESRPVQAGIGSEVFSGTVNESGTITIQTTKSYGESTASKIIDLVENASARKAKSETFITKFARIYTPTVVLLALLLSTVPPLIRLLALGTDPAWSTWIRRALSFLVISCPCAVVVSVPLSFFGGIGGAARAGILVKGANYLETLAEVKTVVFDKTGTLTKGNFTTVSIHPQGVSEEELLAIASFCELHSLHPIAKALREACIARGIKTPSWESTHEEEIRGEGIIVTANRYANSYRYSCGSKHLMASLNVLAQTPAEEGTVVHVAQDEKYLGSIVIADQVKAEAKEAISLLKQNGIKETVMLTGDREEVAQAVADELKIDQHKAHLLPAEKVAEVERLVKGNAGGVAFVGDGINDAPVIARADVGIAMGALGSDAAIEAADVVLMDDDPRKIARAIVIARKTLAIVKINVIFAIAIKVLFLILSGLGFISLGGAVFADVGVLVLCILNATRTLAFGRKEKADG